MYLKEIKTTGFKSFADKMNLVFDNDITCIVGPNGSGKSNIVDAVKWVLGEQSVKTLRGSDKMTDVIFSGSKTRNPLNLATVTLVFDNSDSYLKVPYTEISITRKLYRTGENEYYINNEKCRLKDINDLFLDSGMGKYAFNIISQGEVAKIINASSYERRSVFEEAAGVLKYKKRKEEALRKLDKTNENLVRIKDIVSELNLQIEPLKEESRKAKDYLDIKEKLENIEIALIANDLATYDQEYKIITEKIAELQNKVIEENTNITKNDLELNSLNEKLKKIKENVLTLNNKYVATIKEEEKINGEKNIIKERSKYKADDIKVHDNISNMKEKKLSLNNKGLSLKTDIDILNNKMTTLNNELDIAKKNLEKCLNEKQITAKEAFTKKKQNADLEYKIKSLTNYIEQGGSVPTSVRKVLSNPKLKGLHNTISNLITTSDDYNIALEVALGGAKDYIVVETPTNAKEAINYLKENGLGRVTFYPLNVIKPRFIDNEIKNNITSEEGYIGVLSSLVNYDKKYQNIIENQLGNVIVTQDLDSANKISKIINNRYKIVTLKGEVINVGGSITGGTLKVKSVISEKYELANNKTKLQNLEIELETLENKEKELLEEEQKLNNHIFNIEKQKVLYNEEIMSKMKIKEELRKELSEVDLELKNLTNLIEDNIDEEELRITEKYYEVLNKKENLEKEIKETKEQEEKINNSVFNMQADFRLKNSKIRELETNLKEYEIKSSKISIKMDNLLNILSDTYSMTFEKAKANYILEIDENIARKSVSELRNALRKLGNINLGSIEEYERISTRYEFLTKQKEDLEEAITTLLRIIDELDEVMKVEFTKTFKEIEVEFDKVFKELFGGGVAKLKLTDENNLLETGVDIMVTPPGKRLSAITLLSGGEKTLTAISLLFAILNIKKIPFCIFDEVEAALDEANVDKVGAYFKKYKDKTQLIIITHKKKTMEYANTLYGITMQESGVSKLVSVKLV